jgi:hypothetical protein
MIIDISEKLSVLRRARRLAKEVQRSQLRMAQGLVRVTEDEVQRQMLVLCDKQAGKDAIEEAIELMPLLTELLIERRYHLRCLELEFLAPPEWTMADE